MANQSMNPSPNYELAIIDGHPLIRTGLRLACASSALKVIASVGTGHAGLEAVCRAEPHVAAVELDLPDMRGLTLIQALAETGVRTRSVVLTARQDGAAIYEALGAGAAGFLTKDADEETICEALIAAASGDTVISPQVHRLVATEIRLHSAGRQITLTPRESEVLALVARGYSTPQIGRTLFLSHTTVKTHLAHIYEKFGVSDRAAAVAQGMRRGLVNVIDEAA